MYHKEDISCSKITVRYAGWKNAACDAVLDLTLKRQSNIRKRLIKV